MMTNYDRSPLRAEFLIVFKDEFIDMKIEKNYFNFWTNYWERERKEDDY